MRHWTKGFTQTELDDAQARYGLTFPSDLVGLLLDRRPVKGYDWSGENQDIRRMLAWPFDMLAFDIENGFWWPDWGERPGRSEEREEILRDALARAPRLIPLIAHRFLPESPRLPGNPIFSMHGFDTIYYGSNLAKYFENEFAEHPKIEGPFRHITFWSSLVESFDDAYGYYEAFAESADKDNR